MRNTILSILFIGGLFGGASVPEQATEKMEEKAYAEAVVLYDSTLTLPDYESEKRAIYFNIGQAQLLQDSLNLAQSAYSKCTNLSKEERSELLNRQFASWAWNNIGINRVKLGESAQQQGASPMAPQMGNMPNMAPPQGEGQDAKQRFEEALEAFKSALKMDPENEFARFNYELLKKRMQQAQQQQQDQQDKQDQQNQSENEDNKDKTEQQDQQKQDDKQDGQSKQKNQPQPENKEKKGQNQQQQQNQGEAQEKEISPEQAKALLEAMNEKKKQFIQQLEKRKRKKGRPKRNSGPDW